MRHRLTAFITAFLILPAAAQARAAEPGKPTLEQMLPDRLLEAREKKLVTVVIENDSLGGGTDKNYTSGVRVNFTHIGAKLPAIAHDLDRLLPTFEINKTSSLYYSIGQSLYTPRDIRRKDIDPRDRPWAGFLYGSMGLVTLTDNHTDEVEVTLGVVGPAAMGEWAQKFVHRHLSGSPNPEGWSHQLKNEPGVMLAWQRGWPMLMSGRIADSFWSFKPYAGATVGNVRTYGDAGFTLRLNPYDSKWQDMPIRVRPAMPGTGLYEIPCDKWSWALFAGLEGRAVAHDIFLDGNTFADSHSVDKKHFIVDATAGLALTYKNTRISYTLVYRTKEFSTQDDPAVFGALSFAVRF